VSTLFESASTLEEAEKLATDKAISLLLGNKQTKDLVQGFDMLDISFNSITSKGGNGVKANIVVFKDSKPYRQVSSLALGEKAETEALKSAVNKIMGVR
jgi:hypothetical protein